jgi:hypothetical protein
LSSHLLKVEDLDNSLNATTLMNSNTNNNRLDDDTNNKTIDYADEDVDVDEDDKSSISDTSIKGEGFASDISDNEINHNYNNKKLEYIKHQKQQQQQQQKSNNILIQRDKMKKAVLNSDANLKRPSTPMDIRMAEPLNQQQQQQQNIKTNQRPLVGSGVVKHQLHSNRNHINELSSQNTTSSRFNEWEPYKNSNNNNNNTNNIDQRQKSPQKSKYQTNSSNFAYTFSNTDSSPRQLSGRTVLTSATQNGPKQLTSPQTTQQQQQQQQQLDLSSSSNLELVISGQKMIGERIVSSNKDRNKDSINNQAISPTNNNSSTVIVTPREINNSSSRPFMRRLQPLDKTDPFITQNSNNNSVPSQQTNEILFLKQNKRYFFILFY